MEPVENQKSEKGAPLSTDVKTLASFLGNSGEVAVLLCHEPQEEGVFNPSGFTVREFYKRELGDDIPADLVWHQTLGGALGALAEAKNLTKSPSTNESLQRLVEGVSQRGNSVCLLNLKDNKGWGAFSVPDLWIKGTPMRLECAATRIFTNLSEAIKAADDYRATLVR